MSDKGIAIADQVGGINVATFDAAAVTEAGDPRVIQMVSQVPRPGAVTDASYWNYTGPDIPECLVPFTKKTDYGMSADFGITPSEYQKGVYISDNILDVPTLVILGGVDTQVHLIDMTDPNDPQVELNAWPVIPVAVGASLAAAALIDDTNSTRLYVIGMNGKTASIDPSDPVAWTTHTTTWSTELGGNLVHNQMISPNGRFIYNDLDLGGFQEVSALTAATPTASTTWASPLTGSRRGVLGRLEIDESSRLVLLDIASRQIFRHNGSTWDAMGAPVPWNLNVGASMCTIGNSGLLYVFWGGDTEGNYCIMDTFRYEGTVLDSPWIMNPPPNQANVAGLNLGRYNQAGSQVSAYNWFAFVGGYMDGGTTPSTWALIVQRPNPDCFESFDSGDRTKVRLMVSEPIMDPAQDATSITLQVVLYDAVGQCMGLLDAKTITRPTSPMMLDGSSYLWGCLEWDISGSFRFGVITTACTPDPHNQPIVAYAIIT
jgi:hypothetical protein